MWSQEVKNTLTLSICQARFASQPGIHDAFLDILKAFRAALAPGPIHQTHEAVRKLFWPHRDLIQGFEEWLPKPVEKNFALDPVVFESRVYALEQKVYNLEKLTKSLEKEVEALKGENEMKDMEIDGLKEWIRGE